MKYASASFLVACLIVGGCMDSRINVGVDTENGDMILSATAHLCDRVTPLKRQGNRFSASVKIDCEGSGRIDLRLAEGGATTCIIGYVTPGMDLPETFSVVGSECVSVRADGKEKRRLP